MKLISIEESRKYIPVSEDYFKSPAHYYTKVEDGDGWETITYFTNRKHGLYVGKEGTEYVYILSNKAMPGLLKIGSTQINPEKRRNDISRGTGIPLEFDVEWAYRCFRAEAIEREVHKKLKEFRVNNKREFFRTDLETAIKSIEEIGDKYIK